MAEQEQTGKR